MVKMVLLQSVVGKTWDGGFRADGYKTVSVLEFETAMTIPENELASLFAEFMRKVRNGQLSASKKEVVPNGQ